VILSLMGCCNQMDFLDRYNMAVKSGFSQIPEAKEIEDLLGEADHFIGYSGSSVPKTWNTEVYFGGRYVLTMQVEVETTRDFSTITRVLGEPKFYFHEVREAFIENGQWGARFVSQNQREFGRKEWRQIVAAKGDFSVIGIKLDRNRPIRDFDQYVKAIRRDRLRVAPPEGKK
jgi:hypothetical protein